MKIVNGKIQFHSKPAARVAPEPEKAIETATEAAPEEICDEKPRKAPKSGRGRKNKKG